MIISFDTFGAWATAVKEAKQEQEKNITITENGMGSVLPDAGKTLSKVDYTVNVPQKEEQSKQVTVTNNGLYPVYPDTGKVLSYVEVEGDVHPTEKLTQTITENGTTNLTGEWKDAEIIVDVAGAATKVDVGALGIKLQGSTFGEVPDVFDFSNCTYMTLMFKDCANLSTIPMMDTSKCTKMGAMFYGCANLSSIPQLDTSNVTDMNEMFYGCTHLAVLPQINTSNVTNMQYMFQDCSDITSIPQLDTGKTRGMDYMFYGCKSLTTIPQLDTSSVTNMQYMFYQCESLTEIPALNTSNVTDMHSIFRYCDNLATISQLDMSKITSVQAWLDDRFASCTSLTDLTLVGSLNAQVTFEDSPLNEESIKSVLTAASKTTNTDAKTLTFKTGSTFTDDAEGTWAALVADCTTKGWTIQNLTITPAA